MKQLDPRMEKILRTQGRFIFFNVILSVFLGAYLSANYIGTDVWGFFGGIIISSVLVRIFNAVSLIWLQAKYYGSNIEEMVEDAENAINIINKINEEGEQQSEPSLTKVELTIVNTPDKIFGRFMDHEFYEWLDLKGSDGKVVRFNFKSTMDISRGSSQEIPDGCILLPPGLLYQVDQPVNTST